MIYCCRSWSVRGVHNDDSCVANRPRAALSPNSTGRIVLRLLVTRTTRTPFCTMVDVVVEDRFWERSVEWSSHMYRRKIYQKELSMGESYRRTAGLGLINRAWRDEETLVWGDRAETQSIRYSPCRSSYFASPCRLLTLTSEDVGEKQLYYSQSRDSIWRCGALARLIPW